MAMNKEMEEKLEVARVAAHASEIAAINIRRYLEIHSEKASFVKPVNRVMKIADDLTLEMQKVIEASADLAAKSLKEFTGNK